MHRTEGPDYDTVGGKRRYKESPAPGTVVNKDHMNALQEEICLVIEGTGLTLAATGAADESASWGQLLTAIRRAVLTDVRGFGADATGTDDSTSAFNAALAATGSIFIPPGTFRLDGALSIPANAAIIGSGKYSVLQFNTTAGKISISNQNVFLKGFTIEDGGSLPAQNGINIGFTADSLVILEDLWITEMVVGLYIYSTTALNGMVFGNNIHLFDPRSGGMNLKICDELSDYGCKMINITNLKCIQSTNTDVNMSFNGSISNGGPYANIDKAYIEGGEFEWNDDTKNIWVKNSIIDVEEYNFDSTTGGGFKDCVMLAVNSNTITNNITAASRTFWINVRDADGKISWPNNINGIYVKRRLTAGNEISVANGGSETVVFDTQDALYMARNTSYSKDTVWDAGNSRLVAKGYGNGIARIHVDIEVAIDNLTDHPLLSSWSYIVCVIYLNGSDNVLVPLANVGSYAGASTLVFSGIFEVPISDTNYIEVAVVNYLPVVGTDTVTIDNGSFISVEGL